MDKGAIPGRTENFRVYIDGTDYVGVAEVTLPDIEFMSDTVKGSGILGELELESMQTKAMEVKISFTSTNGNTDSLAAPKEFNIDLRQVITSYDNGSAVYQETGVKYVMRGRPKKLTGGKLATSEKQSNEYDLSVTYYKKVVDGTVKFEIDKFNYIYMVDGTDYLANQRKVLGIG
jgi:P2 family phage contractile tail tube protein